MEDEDKECMGTSNKGSSDKSHLNDQTVESPLKKTKKKSRDKCLVAQRVFVFTKTRAIDPKTRATKQAQEKGK